MPFFGIKVYVFRAFLENDKTDLQQKIFFQDVGENNCSLQHALKSTALGL